MKNQTYRMTMLFDFYGEVLTPRQKEFFDLYYNEDLSLAEIAENYGISRQGVRDVIVRAEAIMTDLEDKTGLMKRFLQMQQQVQAILDAAESVGAAFAPMKKHPPGRLPSGNAICYSMLIGSYTHFRPDPTQGCSVSWGRKRCVFV